MKFTTMDTQHRDRNGQEVAILHIINHPDPDHDAEVLPMVEVQFMSDGFQMEAFTDELPELSELIYNIKKGD